jgi:NAD(P)H-dependent FMN reductase
MSSRVAVIVGSLRRQSWSRKLADEIIRRSQGKLTCQVLEIGELALYNEDLDERPPGNWQLFREGIDAADAVLFVTPEYNRSIPGALKNALDVGSRPGGHNHWAGKPAAVVSQTPYKLGAFGANHALRQTFAFLDMPVLQQPEMYIGGIGEKFAAAGKLTDAELGKLLDNFIEKFGFWIARTSAARDSGTFNKFLQRRDEIATAYVNGDGAPLDAIVTHVDSATFMSPGGDSVTGAAAVAQRYRRDPFCRGQHEQAGNAAVGERPPGILDGHPTCGGATRGQGRSRPHDLTSHRDISPRRRRLEAHPSPCRYPEAPMNHRAPKGMSSDSSDTEARHWPLPRARAA